jgi:thiol-disulfide isomerase/thioredoxin
MGRLPSVERGLAVLLGGVAALGCDTPSSEAPVSRSEQVIATGAMPTAAPAASPSAPAHPVSAPVRARRLCDGDGNAKGRALAKAVMSHVEAPGHLGDTPKPPGAARIDGTVATRGSWTWINFWAAWCGPCKEELPRLFSWQERLAKGSTPVRFVFVSLDDDERQLEQFLEHQPADGIKASLWLPDGPARVSWLGALHMKSSPELPEQALVDPAGHVRCFVEGAVDDGDYAEIASIVGY